MTVQVKLPKEVLRLFPAWEYRCPTCGTYVDSHVSSCLRCKTPFDERKWRIPPRFLQNYETMSEYAHNVLAPKLAPEERRLLFQYFTELFSDGFESGDFSEWSGTDGTVTVVGSPVHHGSYSMTADHTSAWSWVRASKTLDSSQSTVYVRAYVQFGTIAQNIFAIMLYGSSGEIAYAGLGNGTWRIQKHGDGNWGVYDSDPVSITADTWYCLELKVVIHATAGEYRLYVDGDEVVTQTGVDTDNYGNVTTVSVGAFDFGVASFTNVIDCVVVADTYIGPESTQQTYTKTWATDTLFKKLGIQKSLSVNAFLQKQDNQKTFALDTALQKGFSIQKQADALFKRLDLQKSFSVDVRFGALASYTVARQIDVLFKRLGAVESFGLDVCFGSVEAGTYTVSFGLDARFAYKVRLPELWLDENGRIVLNVSKPYAWVGS